MMKNVFLQVLIFSNLTFLLKCNDNGKLDFEKSNSVPRQSNLNFCSGFLEQFCSRKEEDGTILHMQIQIYVFFAIKCFSCKGKHPFRKVF